MESYKTIKRKGITYQIDKEDDENYCFYITEVGDITDEDFLNRWTEYIDKDTMIDTICYINDGYFDYILKIVKDIEKLKDKWEEHSEDFEEIVKYVNF